MESLESRFDDRFVERALEALKAPRGGWADLFLERFHSERMTLGAGGLQRSSGLREGFSVRRVDAGAQQLHGEEGLQEERILAACGSEGGSTASRDATGAASSPASDSEAPPSSWMEDLSATIAARVPGARGVTIRLEKRRRETCAAHPGAPVRRRRDDRTILILRASIEQGSIAAGGGAGSLRELLDKGRVAEMIAALARQAEHLREAREAPRGEHAILLAPGSGGVFFHEACGHALEADGVLEARSPFRHLLGQRVGPESLGAMDDATQPGLEGSYAVDDEGSAGRGTVLIAKGILKSFLADRLTGGLLGCGTTGNGRRESFMDLPLPRMSNAFLMAGDEDPEAILRETASGVYVHALTAGRMDPASGNFEFKASAGSLIEQGRLTTPLRPFVLSGNGPAALRGIRRIGRDLSFGSGAGACGKKGQKLPVATGLPTVLLGPLEVRPATGFGSPPVG